MRRLKTLFNALLICLMLCGAAAAGIPVPADITCSQGEDCSRVVVFKAAGIPTDLTGCSYRAMVRANYTDDTPLAEFNVDTSAVARGQVVITLPANLTAQLAGKVAVWDLRQTDGNGLITYPVRGTFRCYWSVTR